MLFRDWERFRRLSVLPMPGDYGDQPAYVTQAFDAADAAAAEYQAEAKKRAEAEAQKRTRRSKP